MSQNQYVEYVYEIDDANKNGSDVLEYEVDRVSATTISGGGSGYTGIPTVTFSGGTAIRQASGFAVVNAGAVASIVITDPGRYETGSAAPTITITGGGGSSATATATLSKKPAAGSKRTVLSIAFTISAKMAWTSRLWLNGWRKWAAQCC